MGKYTIADIAQRFDVSDTTIRRFVKGLGKDQASQLVTKEPIQGGFQYLLSEDFISHYAEAKGIKKPPPYVDPDQLPLEAPKDKQEDTRKPAGREVDQDLKAKYNKKLKEIRKDLKDRYNKKIKQHHKRLAGQHQKEVQMLQDQSQKEVQMLKERIEELKQDKESLRKDKEDLKLLADQQQKLTAQLQNKIPQLEAPKDNAAKSEKAEHAKSNKKGLFDRLFR
jgi:transposase-like protein